MKSENFYLFYRFEIESGILDEDGETDLENFLDDKDIKQLGKLLKFSLLVINTTTILYYKVTVCNLYV